MLSEHVAGLVEEIVSKYKELDSLIQQETKGRWSLCKPDGLQLFPESDYVHTREELEQLVGITWEYFETEDKTYYNFRLGKVVCCASIPHYEGGASHDE